MMLWGIATYPPCAPKTGGALGEFSPMRNSNAVRTVVVVVVAGLLSSGGCGGRPAAVTGTVTVDGQPLDQGTVGFTPTGGGMRAVGLIQSDGTYELKTNRDRGLEIGEYAVTVTAREAVKTDGGPPMPGKFLAPKRYGSTRTSGLVQQVEGGSNVIDLNLESGGEEEEPKRRRRRR